MLDNAISKADILTSFNTVSTNLHKLD